MQWHDLAFLHWRVRPEALQPFIPTGLRLQTFDGAAWLGVVPFRMAGVRARILPALPGLSAFPELNLRTYVVAENKPGVWFFSLDAANPPAVEAARLLFHLPYFHATMGCDQQGREIVYSSRRTHRGAIGGAFKARYRPTGPAIPAAAGSLDYWLTERYCLYSANRQGRLWRGEIDHQPWPLQPAEVEIECNTIGERVGIDLQGPPLAHFVRRLDVVAWSIVNV
ncbi:MAG: DUF2071 domain-containing protein [Oscillochloris sp.]|nr:DUF2071 domain-containing protein [Oscillochloris sp.]